jgi:hypothetical protein
MKLSDARKLRDEIRERGLHCVVPMDGADLGPDRFTPCIFNDDGPLVFASRQEWLKYEVGITRREEKAMDDYERSMRRDTRTPLERMIDNACGLE